MSTNNEDQKIEQTWETPSQDEIPAISKMHVEAMEATDSDEAWQTAGMHHVILCTVGRKTGESRKHALPVWRDPQGHRIVVASFAGAKHHPAWFLNLEAQPQVVVKTQHGEYQSNAEVLGQQERDEHWALLLADRPHYREYAEKTDRIIPLVRLAESSP